MNVLDLEMTWVKLDKVGIFGVAVAKTGGPSTTYWAYHGIPRIQRSDRGTSPMPDRSPSWSVLA